MTQQLSKSLNFFHFFAIGFGCTIGVAWVVVLGDYLKAAGPLGAILGFCAGGAMISLVALCYAELAACIPHTGGESAFARKVFGPKTSYAIGWFLVAEYIAVSAFEAISITWIIQQLFPSATLGTAYVILGDTVTWEMLIFGVIATFLIAGLHWVGIDKVASIQSIFTWVFLAICIAFIISAFSKADLNNLQPGFASITYGSWGSGVAWLFATAPFWLSGFQIVVQAVEERSEKTTLPMVAGAVVLSLAAATVFYILIILAASVVIPWQTLATSEFAALTAFEAAFGSAVLAKIAMVAALIGLITTWNTVILAAARIMLNMSRSNLLPNSFSRLHPRYKSPSLAIIVITIGTLLGLLGGRGAVIPIVNISALILAFGFAIVSAAVIHLRNTKPDMERPFKIPGGIWTARMAFLASILMIGYLMYDSLWKSLLKGSYVEVAVIIIWAVAGVIFYRLQTKQQHNHEQEA